MTGTGPSVAQTATAGPTPNEPRQLVRQPETGVSEQLPLWLVKQTNCQGSLVPCQLATKINEIKTVPLPQNSAPST